MARQLQAHGETVATLAIIDPSPIKHISQAKSTQNGPPRWQRHQQALARRTFGEKVRYVFTSGRHRFQAIAKVAKDNLGITNLKRMALRLFLLTGQPVPEKWRDFYLMELVSRSAGRSYVPNGRFAGHIDLFLATRAAITWPLAATDGADIKHLAADHLSILKEPHIQVIAQTLQSQLASQN
jgi:thioesterase domain-containing protein